MSRTVEQERTYTISFYPRMNTIPRSKRAQKAMTILREFIVKHMKVKDEEIWISQEVNEEIFSRGMEKPPRKISIRAEKEDDGVVAVYLAGMSPDEFFESRRVSVSTKPSETEIDLEEEDFEEDEA